MVDIKRKLQKMSVTAQKIGTGLSYPDTPSLPLNSHPMSTRAL